MIAGESVDVNPMFGAKLRRAIRVRYGPKQEREFARKIGMDPTQLSRTLNGKVGKRPEVETLQRYADGLGLPLRTVVDWSLPEGARAGDPAPEAGELPSGIVALMREMVRQHPELAAQFDAHQGDDDFGAQVRTLARVLGFTWRGFMEEEGS